ncbi:Tn3 transposase DDE domain protein [Citrobacter koseri]|uniref:Tn3 transposase DDE domain protein n=1 Tax=Citrobacter koseri TaxID=545 RepID=A0A078LMV7_CITKO|nr:Tn3 transposase DDE domain protein [Citrobacter koseri]
MAAAGDLPDVEISDKGVKITPLDNSVPSTVSSLADGINLGLATMAESCPGTTRALLENIQAWYIHDETYSAALAELVNAQKSRPLAAVRQALSIYLSLRNKKSLPQRQEAKQ